MNQGSRVKFLLIIFIGCVLSQQALGQWPWNEQRQSGMTLGGELKAGVLSDLRQGSKSIIELNDSSYIASEWVTLGQISGCQGTQSVCAFIDAIVLGKSRKPGSSEQITQQKLISSLPEFLRQSGQVEFDGKNLATVYYESHEISESQLRSTLEAAIGRLNQRAKTVRLKIKNFRVKRSPQVRSKNISVSIPSLGDMQSVDAGVLKRKFTGQTSIPFVVSDLSTGQFIDKGDLSLYVKIDMKVYVAKQVIGARKILSSDLFDFEWRRVRAGSDAHPGKSFSFGDYIARRQIKANTILQFRDIKRPNLVTAGEQVVLEIKGDGLMLSALVKARKSGQLGDVIDVVYPATRKMIKAKVVAKNLLVRVRL